MSSHPTELSLADRRYARGYTQSDVAKGVDVSQHVVHGYENGKWRPSPDRLRRVCTFYGLTAEEFTAAWRRARAIANAIAGKPVGSR